MPNRDSGSYFLTALIPVLRGAEFDPSGAVWAPSTLLRETLSLTPIRGAGRGRLLAGEAPSEGFEGPFARNLRNHFVRFAVMEDINYNGRINRGALLELAQQEDPVDAQWVDHLSRPFLLFAAEIDNPDGGPTEPDSYLKLLWRTMEAELREIFSYCYGFDAVQDAKAFSAYIRSCQVETTMPFHDYWPAAPSLATFPYVTFGVLAAGLGLDAGVLAHAIVSPAGGLAADLAAIAAGSAMFVAVLVAALEWWAAKPFPMAPRSDLPAVLKSLYLQRQFVRFAAANQDSSPDQLHAAFGAFLATHRPHEALPTQRPGVVGA